MKVRYKVVGFKAEDRLRDESEDRGQKLSVLHLFENHHNSQTHLIKDTRGSKMVHPQLPLLYLQLLP